eukprot:9645095-Prorocentrum_lima.AAC.1
MSPSTLCAAALTAAVGSWERLRWASHLAVCRSESHSASPPAVGTGASVHAEACVWTQGTSGLVLSGAPVTP